MFIENIYFSETDEARYSGFNSNPAIPKGEYGIIKTRPEIIFDEVTPDNIEYTGDRSLKIQTKKGIRYPDFKVTGQNKVIEIFGNYWHNILKVKHFGKSDSPKDIIQEYKEVGIDCLVFWDYEIIRINRFKGSPKPDLDSVLRRTLEFIN